jgi:hypothetical protein
MAQVCLSFDSYENWLMDRKPLDYEGTKIWMKK